jgi:hypothetical protein
MKGLNHEYMAQPGRLRRPRRGAGRKQTEQPKQPNSQLNHPPHTQKP